MKRLTAFTAVLIAIFASGCSASQNALTPSAKTSDFVKYRSAIRAHLASASGGVWIAYNAESNPGLPTSLLYLKYPYTKVSAKITSGVANPGPIATYPAKGYVAAGDITNDTVIVYSSSGSQIANIALQDANASSIVFDSKGSLYVLDSSHNVHRYDPPYSHQPTTIPAATQNYCASHSTCLGVDSHRNVLVTDSENGAVHVWLALPSGSYSTKPFDITQLNNQQPISLGFDAHGNLYVGESDNRTINEYATSTSKASPYRTTPLHTLSLGTLPAEFGIEGGNNQLLFDSSADIFAMGSEDNTIGVFPRSAGNAQPISAGLYDTVGFALDSGRNLLVANSDPGELIAYSHPYPVLPNFGTFNVTYLGRGVITAMAYSK